MQSAAPAATEVQDALTTVLARPEFSPAAPTGLSAWLGRIRDALSDAFWSLMQRLRLDEIGGELLVPVLWTFLGLTALLLVAHVVFSLAGFRRGRSGPGAPASAAARAVPGAAADWTAEAERAAEAGRFRDAVLALYQALLERLQQQGLIRRDPAKTPGDYRRELRPHPRPARGLERFLQHFEPVAFGGREPDRGAFERVRALALEAAGE